MRIVNLQLQGSKDFSANILDDLDTNVTTVRMVDSSGSGVTPNNSLGVAMVYDAVQVLINASDMTKRKPQMALTDAVKDVNNAV